MIKYKYLCQCCGEDFIITMDSPLEGEEPECPHCSEDCTGDCIELERIEVGEES
ncbi:MAG: hypothetical protein ACQEQG_00405 [Bacillota bacterium]